MRLSRWTWVLAAFLAAGQAEADDRAAELLDRTAAAYKGLRVIHIIARREDSAANSVITTEIEFAEKTGGRFFIKMKRGDDIAIKVSNGEKTWKAKPREKQYTEIDAAGSPSAAGDPNAAQHDFYLSMRSLFLWYSRLPEYAQDPEYLKDERIKVGGEKLDCAVVRVRTRASFHEIWIDKQRGWVLQDVQSGQIKLNGREYPSKISVKVKSFETDNGLSGDVFELQPPSNWVKASMMILPGEERMSLAGLQAATFKGKLLDGKPFDLDDAKGKIVVLDFWATWCGPCRVELPAIQKLRHEFEGKVEFIGVNDEEPGTARVFLAKNGYDMPVFSDTNRSVNRIYGVAAIPRLLILDRNGAVRRDFTGTQNETNIRNAILQVMDGTPSRSL